MTHKQHYVPKFYMKQWIDESGQGEVLREKIQYLENAEGAFSTKGPSGICYKDDIYEIGKLRGQYVCPNMLEEEYGRLESRLAPVIRQIVSKTNINDSDALVLSTEEKEAVIELAANMITRNKYYIEAVRRDCGDPEGRKLEEADKSGLVAIMQNVETILQMSPEYRKCNNIPESSNVVGGYADADAKRFLREGKYITILRNKDGAFLFSDNPVICDERFVCLPISPCIAIAFVDNQSGCPRNRITDISAEDAMCLNAGYAYLYRKKCCELICGANTQNGRRAMEQFQKDLRMITSTAR